MTHLAPAVFVVWSCLCVLASLFCFYHLWRYDRFKCLKWNATAHSGAFKRLMTYSYITTLPVVSIYSIGNAVIKYNEGFIAIPELGIIPKPWQMWTQTHKTAIFPLTMMLSLTWSLEMTTHLEELCFWLFLINASTTQQDWFKSIYFKTWAVGSIVAITYVPLVSIFTRSDPLVCEAWTFLAGSLGSFSLTLWFVPILWTFPSFLKNLESEGVDENTIIRLNTFNELNRIRVFFRFLFVVPFIILGIDGVRPHKHVNESMFATDFLGIIAAFGCAISSLITLSIFYPRSISSEYHAKRSDSVELEKRTQQSAVLSQVQTGHETPVYVLPNQYGSPEPFDDLPPGYGMKSDRWAERGERLEPRRGPSEMSEMSWVTQGEATEDPNGALRPNRRVDEEAAIEGHGRREGGATSQISNISKIKKHHPFLKNFRSPIDVAMRKNSR